MRLLFVCLVAFVALSATAATVTGIVPSAAPRGARVVVTGRDLPPDLTISFSDASGAGVSARVVETASDFVEVIVPRTAVTGPVTATQAGTMLGSASFTLASQPGYTAVRTLAGSKSTDDFKFLYGVTMMLPSGNTIVADAAHHQIRMVTPLGVTSILAGSGQPGLVDAIGTAAQFKEPRALAYDAVGQVVYVADSGNHVIRRVTLDGRVMTIAGNGSAGDHDGSGTLAMLKQPSGLALDGQGILYIADTGNNKIKRMTPDGAVATIAGAGPTGFADGTSALFNQPQGIAIGDDGAIYIADTLNNRIRVLRGALVSTVAGSGAPGYLDGASGLLNQPIGLALDGDLIVADSMNHRIRRVSLADNALSTIAGVGSPGLADGSPLQALFKQPAGVIAAGAIFVADTLNDSVRVINQELRFTDLYPKRGPEAGGTLVRLFGTGFLPGQTTVTVNGSAVPATFVTSTELQITMPAGSGTATIAIATPAGSAQLANCYTYLPPPTIAAVQPNKGRSAGGDTVMITGSNFGSIDSTVTFGTTPATVTAISPTSIAATTPPNETGPVDVTVTTPGGSATRTSAFTYLASPTITSISPARGKTAGGDSVTIAGTNFDDTTTVLTIGGAAASNVIVVSGSSLSATTPAGSPGAANVVVTTAGGSATLSGGFTYVPPPVITSFTPAQGTAGSTVTISGLNFDPVAANDNVTIGGAPAGVVSAAATQLVVTVPANAVTGSIAVTTIGGTAVSAANFVVITYRALAITSPVTSLQPGTQQQFTAIATLFDGSTRDVTTSAAWTSSNPGVASVSASGLVTATAVGAADINAVFSGLTATFHVTVQSGPALPPPTIEGPALDPTIVVPLADTIRFLYTGANAVQTGVAANTIDDDRAAIVSGRVTDRSGAPVAGVQVTTAGHLEFGQTLSRADGRFDYAFNGGALLHLTFTKSGFLPADRLVTTKWNQQKAIGDIALVPYDAAVTTVDMNAALPQVAQGSLSSDTDGNRRATLYFPPGVNATLVNADGTKQAATTLHVRATEFTVGPNGPKAMPALLPPASGYTYCVELSVDEAPGVTFSRPIPVYVENFIGFPVGSAVPIGYFDRGKQLWIPAPNGIVIKVLSVTNGVAALDTDGDGAADAQDRLTALGIDSTELAQLGTLYTVGQTLWRVQVDHFTPFDMNWPYGAPSDAVGPLAPPPDAFVTVNECESCTGHSTIETENQRLGEEIPISGTPYSLEYNSARANRQRYQVTVHLSGAALPASLRAIDVSFSIAGRTFQQSIPPQPNANLTFVWDGVDAYDRPVQGTRPADITVAYRYPALYRAPQTAIRAFAASSTGAAVIGDKTRAEISFAQGWSVALGQFSNSATGFGGWSFSAQRVYDTIGRTLYEPGTTERGGDLARTGEAALYRVAGNGSFGTPTSGTATTQGMALPVSIAPAADGGLYFVDNSTTFNLTSHAIYKVDNSGQLSVVAGTPGCVCVSHDADGTIAAGSSIRPSSIAISPDGIVYFSDSTTGGDRIRRIVNGKLETVAGTSTTTSGDNGPATLAGLGTVTGLAFSADGVLYFSTSGTGIRRVGVDGTITTIAGKGTSSADNVPGVQSNLRGTPVGVATGLDGSVYFSTFSGSNFIGRITPDGFVHYIAGASGGTSPQDGAVATTVSLSSPGGLSVTAAGDVVWGDTTQTRASIWTVTGGILHLLAGSRTTPQTSTPPADGSLARAVFAFNMTDTKVGPDGSVFVIDAGHRSIFRTAPLFPKLKSGSAATIIPAADGIIGYVFENARHVRTVNTVTGTTLETLAYDGNGLLTSVTDLDGQVTAIERNPAGVPTAITAPGGQRTTLSVGARGLESVSSPAGSYALDYNGSGLLSQFTDARGGLHKFTYDETGLLTKDEDPAGGFLSLARTGTNLNFTIVRGSAEGRTSSLVWRQSSDVLTSRPVTGPDGLTLSRSENGDGSGSSTTPTGVTTASTVGPDSRFGMSAPVDLTASATLPSGTKMNLTSSRQIFLGNPNDLLSALSYTGTFGVNGRVFTSTFTKSNRTTVTTTPANRQITTVLNDKDRPASVQVPGLSAVAYGYDPRGMISSIVAGARNTTFGYDLQQRLKSVRDPLGRTMSFDYDDADRLTTETLPDGRQIHFTHDPAGNVTSVTPPSRPTHSFGFTPVDLLESYTAPAVPNVISRVTTYTYNRDRQLTHAARPDGTAIDFGYDTAGRLASITEPLGRHGFTYDPAKGTLTTMSSPDGNALQFTYDGDLLKSVISTGAVASTVTFGYDSSFRAISEAVSGSSSVAFGYDNDDLLTSAGALTVRRDANNGLLTGTTLGDLVDVYGYNSFGEVTSYSVQLSGSPLLAFGYTRDDAGRVATKTETVNGQTTATSFGYDTAGRLTDVTTSSATTHYGYDDNGNRTSMQTASGTISATYDAQDRLTTYDGATYFYSANGELQKKIDAQGTTLYNYDVLGNLQTCTLPDGKVIEYVIDASNRRVGKKVNGTLVTGWIYGDQLRILAETDGNGAIMKRFVYGSRVNVPDYMIWQGSTYRIVADHLGSPRYVLEATAGALAQEMTYDNFGNVVTDSNVGFQPFGFAGGLYDRDTKLVRFGARDYDPAAGRWTAKDLIGFEGGDANLYDYVFADPVNFVDPFGTDIWLEGPVSPEPQGHLSLNVGDPNGEYDSYSFGVNDHLPGFFPGEVYRDISKGGAFEPGYYLKTTPEEDSIARAALERLVGNRAPYRAGRTCRTFARDNFWRLHENLHLGRHARPPFRAPNPNMLPSTVPGKSKSTVE
jgi:RHS repeat-associated protein